MSRDASLYYVMYPQEMKLIISEHMVLRKSLTKCYETPNLFIRGKQAHHFTGDAVAPAILRALLTNKIHREYLWALMLSGMKEEKHTVELMCQPGIKRHGACPTPRPSTTFLVSGTSMGTGTISARRHP